MSKAHPPELKKYMDKRVMVKLNGGRVVEGTLRGFDPFMNLVVDEGTEVRKGTDRVRIGICVIRGSSIIMLESLDRIS
ncbi:probable small nuclear ribonucleoprotein G [Eriocheir sinensis]|uniref:probable small nuclear ribonucleoprotein G n=1 Tax=Eriocheir sinensis TaxID=95602 RepID=UPI0021C96D9F|nr:probable small nuclear ribonucleoprotein G [Eriocheir sinensis]